MRIRDALRFLRYVNEAANVQVSKKNAKSVIRDLEKIVNSPKKSDISDAQKDKIEATIEDSDDARSKLDEMLSKCKIRKDSEIYNKIIFAASKNKSRMKDFVGALRKRFSKKGVDFSRAFGNSFPKSIDVLNVFVKELEIDIELVKDLYDASWKDGNINHGSGEALLALFCNGGETSVGKGNGDIKIDGYPIEVKASNKFAASSAGRLTNGRDLKGDGDVRDGIFGIIDKFYVELNKKDAVKRYGEVVRKSDRGALEKKIKIKYTGSQDGRIDNIILSDINDWVKKYSVDEAVLENVIREMVINFFKMIWGNFFFSDDEKGAVASIIDSHLNGRTMSKMLGELSVIPTKDTTKFGYELLAFYILRYINQEGLLIFAEGKGGIVKGSYLGKDVLGGNVKELSEKLADSDIAFAWPEIYSGANQKVACGIILNPSK